MHAYGRNMRSKIKTNAGMNVSEPRKIVAEHLMMMPADC